MARLARSVKFKLRHYPLAEEIQRQLDEARCEIARYENGRQVPGVRLAILPAPAVTKPKAKRRRRAS